MGIYYLQLEMYFQWKDVKKHNKIDIYKQDFGWLTYTHTKIYILTLRHNKQYFCLILKASTYEKKFMNT